MFFDRFGKQPPDNVPGDFSGADKHSQAIPPSLHQRKIRKELIKVMRNVSVETIIGRKVYFITDATREVK